MVTVTWTIRPGLTVSGEGLPEESATTVEVSAITRGSSVVTPPEKAVDEHC